MPDISPVWMMGNGLCKAHCVKYFQTVKRWVSARWNTLSKAVAEKDQKRSKLLICLDDDSLPASWLRCGVLVTADSRVQWWMHLRSDCLLCVKPSCNFLSLQCHFLLHCVLARALSFVTLPPPAHQPCLYVVCLCEMYLLLLLLPLCPRPHSV